MKEYGLLEIASLFETSLYDYCYIFVHSKCESKYPELRAYTFKKIAASTGGIAGAIQFSHVTVKLTIK